MPQCAGARAYDSPVTQEPDGHQRDPEDARGDDSVELPAGEVFARRHPFFLYAVFDVIVAGIVAMLESCNPGR